MRLAVKEETLASRLDRLLADGKFAGYTYSYPHKMAYRPFEEPFSLKTLWENEKKDALFLYVHIPFCEMRCGFCNLFTVAKPGENLRAPYPEILREQAIRVKDALGASAFSRIAIGGGTPTQLDPEGLHHVCETIRDVMGADAASVPACSEMSPETITDEKLAVLRSFGYDRASMGVQSFLASETKSLRRPQEPEVAHAAIELIRKHGFETTNIDLIYGIRDQTPETWNYSIDSLLEHRPEEIYLYPLYVRPLTGLGNSKRGGWEDTRHDLYKIGRERLLNEGYEQVSMRMFRLPVEDDTEAPIYRCQEDGMVGLGVGARSYTRSVHYCTEYAVGRPSVMGILEDFVERESSSFDVADFGFVLDQAEQERRYLVLSILSADGFSPTSFRERFGKAHEFDDVFAALASRGLSQENDGVVALNAEGIASSDVIGPWLYSGTVQDRVEEYELR